jgi:hypothetical protein
MQTALALMGHHPRAATWVNLVCAQIVRLLADQAKALIYMAELA